MGPDLLAVTPAHSELRGQLPQTPRSRLIGFQHLHTQIIRIRLCHRLVFAKIAKPTMTALPFPAYNYCDSALVLHDTTEFSYKRTRIESVGLLRTTPCWPGKGKKGMPCLHTVCGILMHSSLAVTTEGLPLGLVAVKYWTRRKFQHTRS